MKKKKQSALTLDEIHSALLEIMLEFDRVCRENGLKYSLAYGTLIGAIRHKGFIPWDDDVDVVMPRSDYEKFYELAKSGALGEHFLISEDRGKKAFYPFYKVMDKRYSLKSWSHIEVPYLYIDVFPLDGVPEDAKALKKLYRRQVKYSGICALARWAVLEKKASLLLRFLLFPFYLGCTIYGKARACRKANYYAMQYDFETSARVGRTNFGTTKWTFERDKFLDLIEIPFAGHSFYSIAAYDEWLRLIYGDYMKLPPENKRHTHCMEVRRVDSE